MSKTIEVELIERKRPLGIGIRTRADIAVDKLTPEDAIPKHRNPNNQNKPPNPQPNEKSIKHHVDNIQHRGGMRQTQDRKRGKPPDRHPTPPPRPIRPPPRTLGRLGGAGSPLGKTLGGYTAPPSTPSSTGALVPRGRPQGNGRLVSGRASRLDAFSGYPPRRGCPAVPCRTTGTLEAAAPRSSRTEGTFPSGGQRPRQVETDLSRDGLNPSHVPL